MKILATCLLGPGAEASVGDALRSVADAVDGYLLIESGGGGAALRAAYDAATKPIETTHFDWIGDYGAARQFALDEARKRGADFALTIDPDERLVNATALRAEVEMHPDLEVFLCRDRDDGYFKERVLRCDSRLHWHGRVCEHLQGHTMPQGRTAATFWELPKDEAAHRRRHERGVIECQRMIEEGDDCYRWRRHLATCLLNLGRREEALGHLRSAHALAEHDEDKAWSWYLLCEQAVLDGEHVRAMEDAARGLVDHAGFLPEYSWIIAYCQMQLGNKQNALRWAQIGAQCPNDKTRLSFRSRNARGGCQEIMAALLGSQPVRAEAPEAPAWVEYHGIRLPTGHVSTSMRRILASGGYEGDEIRTLARLLTPSDRVLELGTGIGFLATYCAKRLEDSSRVLTVEADPRMREAIEATFAANSVAPELMIAAVGHDAEPHGLKRAKDFWSTRTVDPSEGAELVDGVALSALVERHSPTVIVCDIEGSEGLLVQTELPGVRAVLIETHGTETDWAVSQWLQRQDFRRLDVGDRVRLYERSIS